MKIASTAALAWVEPPKINRRSRSQHAWYVSAHAPDPKHSSATCASGVADVSGALARAAVSPGISGFGRARRGLSVDGVATAWADLREVTIGFSGSRAV